jgi:hypothetical protein
MRDPMKFAKIVAAALVCDAWIVLAVRALWRAL